MKSFQGFPEGKAHSTPIPDQFFQRLFPFISDPAELKLTIYFFYMLEKVEGAFRFLRRMNFSADDPFMDSLSSDRRQAETLLDQALEMAVQRGTLLAAQLEIGGKIEDCYFLNSPRGRAALEAIHSGQWQTSEPQAVIKEVQKTNIFQLYEQHIGPLAPMIAEELGEAQDAYPEEWFAEAFGIAVAKDKRSWRYVLAILERWQREGTHGRQEKSEDRRSTPETRRRYIEGEFADHIEH